MPALWHGHEFPGDELTFWSQEIVAAAIELPASERAAFVASACEGSDRLRAQVEASLDHVSDFAGGPPAGQTCRAGDVLRDCLILYRVGRGGTAEVYKAIQRPLRRIVAVKVLTGDRGNASQLAREATSTSRLLHPNIAAVYDAEVLSDRPCVVMEYVDAISLRVWLQRHWARTQGPPPLETVKSIARQVGLALREAHAQGLVHRDIKPENILLTKRGDDYRVKVVDFGIARRVEAPGGDVSGTPGYISPEQLNGGRPDRRADVFSLGAVLYEMLFGRHPFAGRSDAETFFNTVAKEPEVRADETPADVCAVVSRALRKAPAERYQTIDELLADLESSRSGGRDAGSNPLLSELPAFIRTWSDRHSSGFAVAAASCVWGCLSLALSVACGAACVRVLWEPAVGASRAEMIYGYAIEPNAGLMYLAGASLFFLAGFGFLQAAHHGLARTPALTVVMGPRSGSPAALQRVADRNRHYFRYLTPLIVVFSVGFVLIPEVAFRENHAFGWVQADLAARYVSTTYDSLQRAGKIGDLPLVTNLCNGCPVRVAAVYNDSSGFRPPSRLLFDVFLVSALAHQIVLTSFLLWIGLKVLFFFGLLSTALLSDEDTPGLRLVPDLQDKDDYRFGLGRLDNVYYALLLFGAIASLARFLQASANVSKGTYFFAGDPAPALVGQPVVLFGVVALLGVLLFTPVAVFLFLTVRAVDEELARLAAARKHLEEQRLAARREDRDRLQSDIDMLRERRDTAKKQSLLPIRRPAFIGLLVANLVILLVLPKSIGWLGNAGPGGGDTVWHAISDSVCAACGNAPRFAAPEP